MSHKLLDRLIERVAPDVLVGFVDEEGNHIWLIDGERYVGQYPYIPKVVFIYYNNHGEACPLINNEQFWNDAHIRAELVYLVYVHKERRDRLTEETLYRARPKTLIPCNGKILEYVSTDIGYSPTRYVPAITITAYRALGYPDQVKFYMSLLSTNLRVAWMDGRPFGLGISGAPGPDSIKTARLLFLHIEPAHTAHSMSIIDAMELQVVDLSCVEMWKPRKRMHVGRLCSILTERGPHYALGDCVTGITTIFEFSPVIETRGVIVPVSDIGIWTYGRKGYKAVLTLMAAAPEMFPNLISVWRCDSSNGDMRTQKQSPVVSVKALRMRLAQTPDLRTERFFGRTDTKNKPKFTCYGSELATQLAVNRFGRRAKFYGLLYIRRALHDDPAVRRTAGWLGSFSRNVMGLIAAHVLCGTSAEYAQGPAEYPMVSRSVVTAKLKKDIEKVDAFRNNLMEVRRVEWEFEDAIHERRSYEEEFDPAHVGRFMDWLLPARQEALAKIADIWNDKRTRSTRPDSSRSKKRRKVDRGE